MGPKNTNYVNYKKTVKMQIQQGVTLTGRNTTCPRRVLPLASNVLYVPVLQTTTTDASDRY